MKKKCEYRKTYQVKGDNHLKIKGIKKLKPPNFNPGMETDIRYDTIFGEICNHNLNDIRIIKKKK